MNTDERSRKNEAVVLQALASTGLTPVADSLSVSESTVSRMKDVDVGRFSTLLAVCGLKVVPQSYRCAKPEMIEAALVFARAAMERVNNDDAMMWDD